MVDRSGSVILEHLLQCDKKKAPVITLLGLKETIAVNSWYIWWQRQGEIKGNFVA
jgi:hypothetical protein